MSEEFANVYAAPESDLTSEGSAAYSEAPFFTVSTPKLWVMSIGTMGIYHLYWFYKNWNIQRKLRGESTMPFFRALFYIFFTHSLFRRVAEAAQAQAIPHKWAASTTATAVVAMVIGERVLDRLTTVMPDMTLAFSVIGILLVIPVTACFVAVQRTANEINGDVDGDDNARYGAGAVVMLLLGALLWIMVIVGFAAIATGTIPAS